MRTFISLIEFSVLISPEGVRADFEASLCDRVVERSRISIASLSFPPQKSNGISSWDFGLLQKIISTFVILTRRQENEDKMLTNFLVLGLSSAALLKD